MAVPVCTLDGLNLQANGYTIMSGIDVGVRLKTWDEQRSYAGGVTQTNVSEAYIIQMTLPLEVQGSSLADLNTKVQAVNTKIDSCSSASPKSLVFDGTTYQIVSTPRVGYVIDLAAEVGFRAAINLVLNRLPT